jgi:5-methylcytosine-specific restriction enzyme A
MFLKSILTARYSAVMNRKSLIDSALQRVADSLGISLIREFMPTGHDYELKVRLAEIPAPHGFNVKVEDRYLNWKISLNFDPFSAPLLDSMQERYRERSEGLESYLELATAKNNTCKMLVNNTRDWQEIDKPWSQIDFEISKSYFSEENEFEALESSLLDFMCVILFLIVEDIEWQSEEMVGEEEGAAYSMITQKYERSRYNRAICLKYYGFNCRGCGDALEEKYGPIGHGVIHVHHITPVSLMGGGYKLNPIKDLIPLCPNCHNIVHRKTPPLSIDELRQISGYSDAERNLSEIIN